MSDKQNQIQPCTVFFFLLPSFQDFIYLFLERGEETEREGEKHRCETETSIDCLSYMPQPTREPATQACALTGNRTTNLCFVG